MIRYFRPDSSERSRRIWVAHSTYSGIESSSKPMNSVTRFSAATSTTMPSTDRQQQRVELALARLGTASDAPRQQDGADAAGANRIVSAA